MANVRDMTEGSPARNILNFALPLVLGYVLQHLYQVVDAAIVGRWVGVEGLAAVGASSSIMFLFLGFCNGACAGFSVPVAQAFGAKEYSLMRQYVANAIRIGIWISVLLTIPICVLCSPILRLVNVPDDIFHQAWIYLMLQFLGIPLAIAYNLLAGFIRSLGNSKEPFYFLLVSSATNIILDLIFVIVFRWGVFGAGFATLISQIVSASLCYSFIIRQMKMLIPVGEERRYDSDHVTHLLNNGIPMGLQFSITGIGVIMLQSANNALGTMYVAAFTASMRVKYVFTTVFENIGVAMATYCGQNIGARRLDRVKSGLKAATGIMLVYFVFTFAVIFPFADEMMALFVDPSQRQIIDLASQYMRISNYFYPVLGMLTIFRYSIQGLGYSTLSLMSGVMEMLARCAVSIWMVPAMGFMGVCLGDPAAWCAADLFLFPAMYFLLRHLGQSRS
ncbi:MAG: MATE family efflux transporter [Bacteroidales bacterium]|jgi:putative MATE family efflux protein|nr:MATE family efflux transporter [Bacteroidales bacterium]MCI2136445.1 MATE family efflux transporter [Bacteroidales bacterium]